MYWSLCVAVIRAAKAILLDHPLDSQRFFASSSNSQSAPSGHRLRRRAPLTERRNGVVFRYRVKGSMQPVIRLSPWSRPPLKDDERGTAPSRQRRRSSRTAAGSLPPFRLVVAPTNEMCR